VFEPPHRTEAATCQNVGERERRLARPVLTPQSDMSFDFELSGHGIADWPMESPEATVLAVSRRCSSQRGAREELTSLGVLVLVCGSSASSQPKTSRTSPAVETR
jgi:hypothetical protein